MNTTVLFNRPEGGTTSTFGVVRFTCEHSADPKVLLSKLQSAITEWVNETEEGKAAWDESCTDFNIGDFAGYEDSDSLAPYLEKQSIKVEILVMNDTANVFNFDTLLVDTNQLSEDEE